MGCTSVPVTPTPAPTPASTPSAVASPTVRPSGPLASATPSPRQVGPLELAECDPLGYVRCEHQAVALRVPIAGTGVALTYSSEWQPGRLDRPQEWDPSSLGLGGWTLDVLQRYDAANGVLLGGDGSWRLAGALTLSNGEVAVPSFDGRLAYVFDAAGRHVRTVQAILGVDLLRFTYDDAGRLLTADGSVDNAPVHLVVERSPDGTIDGLSGAGGAFTRVDLDGAGYLGSITHPDGGSDGFFTDGQGLVTVHIDPARGLAKFDYDDSGRLATATDADRVATTYAHTGATTEIQVTVSQPLGASATYRTRLLDGAIERTYLAPGGQATTVVESSDGQRTVTLPDGTDLTIGVVPDPRWASAAPILTPTVETRPDGVVRRTEIGQVVETTSGDPLRIVAWSRSTTINGARYVERLDPGGRKMTLADPLGRTTEAGYDDHGRLIAFTVPGQPAATFAYDDQGRLASDTRGVGGDAAVTTYSYGDNGRLTITRPDGVVETLVVDARGRPVQRLTGGDSTVLTSYDALGRPILVRPGGGQSTTLGYSAAGRPTAFVPPPVADDSSYERMVYDDAGRLATVSGAGSRAVSLAYDGIGRVSQISFDRGQINVQYDDATGRISSISAPEGITTNFDYDGPFRAQIAWSGPVAGSVALQFDALGQIVGESIDGGASVASTRDSSGLLTAVGAVTLVRDSESGLPTSASLGVVRIDWQYDANGRLALASATVNGTSVLSSSYTRDALGRISVESETSPAGAHTTAYQYNPAGRLVEVTVDATSVERSTYDAAGNRISVSTTTSPLVTAEYDARNRLSRWAATTFDYAPDGTLARRTDAGQVSAFDIDDLGTLRAVVQPDGRRVEYVVDGSRQRIGRIVDGAVLAGYLYRPDGLLVAELDGAGHVRARFGYDDQGHLISMERDGRTFLVVTDHLGSPLLVIDSASGEIAESIAYDAWGRVLSDSNPGFEPFGFAGGLRDVDTGLVHFGVRDYDPAIGRWIEPDPMRFASNDANLYSYSAGDPVNRSDPTGLQDGGQKLVGPGEEGWWEEMWYPRPDVPGDGYEKWYPRDDGWEVCRPAGGGQECYPWHGPDPGPDVDPSGGTWPPEEPPPAQPQPTPPDPGNNGGGFTCVGICFPPGGGLCIGYCSSGDPHVRTADRLSISFQGAGEYLMARSVNGAVVIQARHEPPFHMTQVTITTALAVWVAGDRVAIYLGGDGVLSLRVNGELVDGTDIARALPHGGSVTRHGTSLLVEWPDGSRLAADQRGIHLDYGFTPDPAIAPTLTGLMGTPDGDVTNDLVSRDGSLMLDPSAPDFLAQLHGPFGDSWRIEEAESLFDYGPGESTASFTRPEIPTGPSTPDGVPPDARATAEALCRAVGAISEPTLSDCIVDVGLTGDPSYAASASAVQAATEVAPPPPGVAQPIASGDNVVGRIGAAEQIDQYTFAGSTGQTVNLDSLGQCMGDMSWDLLGPANEHLVSGVICNDLGPWTIRADGTYVIKVYSHGVATGSYAFQLRLDP